MVVITTLIFYTFALYLYAQYSLLEKFPAIFWIPNNTLFQFYKINHLFDNQHSLSKLRVLFHLCFVQQPKVQWMQNSVVVQSLVTIRFHLKIKKMDEHEDGGNVSLTRMLREQLGTVTSKLF